uniref:Strobilurin A biosynthesis cluster protein r1 n=1 Tax=Strobilurus tenacellus TaxID=41251 RepID=STR1_STRTC|nr:RecName: Full=Strobilurin A biosynthesis cluster protein r1 [Strobilurus tenacellus]ATV82111.1 hypothetical protein [Strobilurus tenacellus]
MAQVVADPIVDKSAILKSELSKQPETLIAYAKWYGKVAGPITGVDLSAIDAKSLTLICTLSDGSKQQVRIELSPPLARYEDAKPRLLEMKTRALEGLGLTKTPVITNFIFPSLALKTTIWSVAGLLYLTFVPNPYLTGANIPRAWAAVGLIHGPQAIYTATLARKHVGNLTTGVSYVLGTLVFGFPFWIDLRQRITAARVESVAKIQ